MKPFLSRSRAHWAPFVPVFLCLASSPTVLPALHSQNAAAPKTTIHFREISQQTINARLQRFSTKNAERERNLKSVFEEAGCRGERLSEQPVKHQKLPNLVCSLGGTTDSTIIIGAHFDKVDVGKGVVDNWSSASLLPSLFQALSAEPRKHTFIFIAFTQEEEGLIGSSFYVKQLNPGQISTIRAMVNLDCLGLGPTKIWLNHSDAKLASKLYAVSKAMNVALEAVNADQVGDDDSTSFRKRNVPTVMLHSVTQETFPILHSSKDDINAIKVDDYYASYRLIAAYLSFLDVDLD